MRKIKNYIKKIFKYKKIKKNDGLMGIICDFLDKVAAEKSKQKINHDLRFANFILDNVEVFCHTIKLGEERENIDYITGLVPYVDSYEDNISYCLQPFAVDAFKGLDMEYREFMNEDVFSGKTVISRKDFKKISYAIDDKIRERQEINHKLLVGIEAYQSKKRMGE